jgi:hypothetical protein
VISVRGKRFNLRSWSRQYLSRLDKALEETARAAPKLQRQQIMARRTPDGTPQKRNAPATVARKGHDHPLVDTGLLAQPSAYPIRRVRGGWVAELPASRARVVEYLRAKGYDTWRVGREMRAEFRKILDRHIRQDQAGRSRHSRRR